MRIDSGGRRSSVADTSREGQRERGDWKTRRIAFLTSAQITDLISADCRIDNAIIHLPSSNRAPAQTWPPTFGIQGSQATLPDESEARVTG
jgi:hypothetical protein